MKRLAKMITGAVLSVALVGSVAAAFAGCGSKDIEYQFQGYCYDHGSWGIITLYADGTMDGYENGTYGSANTYGGTWEIEENRFYTGLTVTYTSDKNEEGDISTDPVTVSAVADDNGNFAFGLFTLPVNYHGYAVLSGCSKTYSEQISSDNYWTNYKDWYATVEGTVPVLPPSSVVSISGKAVDSKDDTDYSIDFLDDLTVTVTAGTTEYTGTWTCTRDGDLSITMDDSSVSCVVSKETETVTNDDEDEDTNDTDNDATTTSVTEVETGNLIVTFKSGDTEKATFTIKAKKLTKLENAAVSTVATFTGTTTSGGTVTAYFYSDNSLYIENTVMSAMTSDGTWSYSDGKLTISLNGTLSSVSDISISSEKASFKYTCSMIGISSCEVTCDDVAEIAAIMGNA